eukprot:4131624-Prorocentrum_lima.AAC.1
MLPDEEAPELQPIARAGQLRLGHDQLVTDGALDRTMQHPAELAVLETRGKAHPGRVPLCRDGVELLLGPLQDGTN